MKGRANSRRRGSARQRRREDFSLKLALDMKVEECLKRMCDFLERTPQPSSLAVQAQFILIRDEWVDFCKIHRCTDWVKGRFNREFRTIWEKRYRRNEPQNQESEEGSQPLS